MKLSRVLRHALLATALTTGLCAADGDLTALRAKAEKGNAIAQYNLGLAYAEGRDTPVDRVEAYVWLSLALENGARGRALDALTAQLSPTELATAQARLAARHGTAAQPDAAPASTAPAAPADNSALERELAQARTDKQQLSTELATAWKEVDQLKTDLAKAKSAAPDTEQLRRERDSLSTKLTELAGDIAALRTDRERLQKLAAQMQKDVSDARETNRAYLEQGRVSEMRVGELVRRTEELKAELERARQSLAALKTPSPSATVENPELTQKTRALQAALADLETARGANEQLSAALAKSSTERSDLEKMLAQAQSAALLLGKHVDELTAEIAALKQAPATAAYPDLRERVVDLEAQVTALRNAPPAYPDLRPQVAALEAQLANANTAPAAPAYPDVRDRVSALEAQLAEANRRADTLDTRATALANEKGNLTEQLDAARNQRAQDQRLATTAQAEAEQLRAAHRDLQAQLADRANAAPAYPDLRERVADLEAQAAALRSAPPAYPDLRSQVAALETQLARAAAPAYPDVRDRVSALEAQLAEANRRADTLDTRATALANEKSGLDRDIATARTQLSRSQQQADIAQDSADKLRAANRALQEQLAAAAPSYPDLRQRVTELEAQLAAAPNYPDLRGEVAELQQQLAAARGAAPAYPDLRQRVAELESQLARAARPSAPAYPDLSGRVNQLESALATAQAQLAAASAQAPATGPTPGEDSEDLRQKLATAEDKLATALTGYSQLQKDFDALQASTTQSTAALSGEKDSLASRLAAAEDTARNAQAEVARLSDALAATQRGSSQAGTELASVRALLQQVQGSNTLLAQENYQLKAALSSNPTARSAALTAAAANVRTHTVGDGDSLSKLSQRYYGTATRWQEIYAANRDLIGPQGQLRVGQVLRIP